MKLNAFHIFLLLIGSLLLCSMLNMVGSSNSNTVVPYEGMTSGISSVANVDLYEGMTSGISSVAKVNSYTGPAGDTVYTYNTPGSTQNTANSNVTSYTSSPQVEANTNYNGYNQPNVNVSGSESSLGDNSDLYILKSQVVPPVCPACPSNASCPRPEPPPPCPPCARCPEPSFECKKVPNYRANDDTYMPRPVLSDFSSFGM